MVFTILSNRYRRLGGVFYAGAFGVHRKCFYVTRIPSIVAGRCDIHYLCTLIKGFCGMAGVREKIIWIKCTGKGT